MLNRDDYRQCAFVIPKGGFDEIRSRGLPSFREEIAQLAPYLHNRSGELADWSDVKLLSVSVGRLRKWYRTGLLCIGDAAHAMSPVGGVGINLAIQDAVAAANILAPRFKQGNVSEQDLRAVQRRREFPVRATQTMQGGNPKAGDRPGAQECTEAVGSAARSAAAADAVPDPSSRPAVGLGIRPEHVRTPVLG